MAKHIIVYRSSSLNQKISKGGSFLLEVNFKLRAISDFLINRKKLDEDKGIDENGFITKNFFLTDFSSRLLEPNGRHIVKMFGIEILPKEFGIEFEEEVSNIPFLSEEDKSILCAGLKFASLSQKPLLAITDLSACLFAKNKGMKNLRDNKLLSHIFRSFFSVYFWVKLTSIITIYATVIFWIWSGPAVIFKVRDFIYWLNLNPFWQYCFIALLGFFTGTVLFVFRTAFRNQYGFFEILFGILSIEWSLNQQSSTTNQLFALIAGCYIIVRGWDNISKYYETKRAIWPLSVFLKWLKDVV